MKLHERLGPLVGHDFIVNLAHESEDGEMPPGRLQEVGQDYIVLRTKSTEEGGFVEAEGEWFVLNDDMTSLIHTVTDCAGCAVDAALRVKKEEPNV